MDEEKPACCLILARPPARPPLFDERRPFVFLAALGVVRFAAHDDDGVVDVVEVAAAAVAAGLYSLNYW